MNIRASFKHRGWLRARVSLLALALVGLASGCVGYRLGSALPGNIRRLHVPIFENRSEEPLIEADLTREVIRALQRDATFQVVRPDQPADGTLKVVIQQFVLAPVGYQSGSHGRADTYRLTVVASFTLTDSSGKIVAQHPRVHGDTIAPVVGDLTSSKLAALPAAAQELARDIVDKLTETW
jgi:outer membrane lipopolysaccharide assembly protein LptE/RlpB